MTRSPFLFPFSSVDTSHLLETLVDNGLDAIVITDGLLTQPGPRILYTNTVFTQMTGYSPSEVLGSTPRLLQGPNTSTALLEQLRHCLQQGQSFRGEAVNYRKDGSEYQVEWSISPVRDADGLVRYWVSVQRDVTQQRQAEEVSCQNEQRYRNIIETTTEGAWVIDPEGQTSFVNDHMANMLGYTPVEMIGQTFFDFMDEEGKQLATRLLARRRAGVREQHDFKFQHRDSRAVWAIVSTDPLYDAEGRFVGALGLLTDITSRKKAEEEMRLFNRVLQATTNGVVVADARQPETPIIYCNPAFERLTGYTLTEMVGRSCRFLQGPETEPEAVAQLRQAMVEVRECQILFKNYRKDGSIFLNEFSLAPICDEHGTLTHFVGVHNDVTARIEAEQQRRELAQACFEMGEMAKMSQLKDDFLSTVSHELRTPLTNMTLALHLLEQESCPERKQRYWQIIKEECNREHQLINDLLDLQRLEAGKRELVYEWLQLQRWLPELLELFQTRTQQRRQYLKLNFDEQFPDIWTDRRSLERILIELLNNACKYTPPDNDIVVGVEAPGSQGQQVIQVTVTNYGIEIPAHELPRLFEKFYRVPQQDRWQQGGTGLGLALVKQLSEELGGSIVVQSGQGQTSFRVALPCLPIDSPT
ncbi:PAS domain S-box protein [Candidatus Cyanaurora vandensis]|uniref:PAS domain S-box protein n=2 Tax=Candidatus Cyanaurora vandensis TaxID=2714958 RepID=UPI00257A9F8E|nr:PAS domain S-box protein [Candidatus Cyanaurora vandensis]